MADNSTSGVIQLPESNYENFYLDPQTADVRFVCCTGTGRTENVPAHKIVLSAGSKKFKAICVNSWSEQDLVIDASPAAFKEFLQFFYLKNVRLTPENIFQVINLCKRYEVNNGLKYCEAHFQTLLTISNMCSGYGIALRFEMEHIVKYCEKEIKENAIEILKSSDFLNCNHHLFDRILQLVLSECSGSFIVDGCTAWAKAKCGRGHLEVTSENMRAQLKNSFERIPFEALSQQQFAQCIKTYGQMFISTELMAIILKRAEKTSTLVCDRRYEGINSSQPTNIVIVNKFISNTKLLLKKVHIAALSPPNIFRDATVFLHNDHTQATIALGTVQLNSDGETCFILPFQIAIEPNVKYGIRFHFDGTQTLLYQRCYLRDQVGFECGVEVSFDTGSDMITCLTFERLRD